jgi:O-antigen chain-terminating methyltransferase
MWELPVEPYRDDAAGRVYGFRAAAPRLDSDHFYSRLDEVFRGPRQFVADRQRSYLGLIATLSPVLDIGCGRGVFLDLLRESGIEYVGVDPDAAMLEACRAHGHEALVNADANSYLEGLPDEHAGVIFTAQVLEHLSWNYLLRFLALALDKLKPGARFIAECPNPHSVHSHKEFWFDPTHESEVFPEMALALCWLTGFASAFIFHPAGSGDADADRFAQPEFAVVATKGMSGDDGISP